jgi:hypothetical protein
VSTLRFSAANDEVRFNLPAAANFTGAYTLAALVLRRAVPGTVWHAITGHHSSTSVPQVAIEFDGTNHLELNENNGAASRTSTATVSSTTDWYLVAATKAAGTVTPKLHTKNLTTGAWAHDSGAGTLANAPTATGGTIRVGEWNDNDDLNANVAVIGGWAAELTDLAVEALLTNLRTSDWTGHATAPAYVHELTSTTTIPDLMGNGATLNIVSGTTLDTSNDPPGWNFNGTSRTAPRGGALPQAARPSRRR